MEQVWEALRTGGGMLWKALWALIFGYLISGAIQVLITHEQMAKALGDRSAKRAGLAGFFGFVSSSCSFAALAASRSVLVKGAHPSNALAFLIASTNLVIELGIVLLVLLSWHFLVGNFAVGLLMIVYSYIVTAVWMPEHLMARGKRHAQELEAMEMRVEAPQDLAWHQKLRTRAGWLAIAAAFVNEWRMVWKELLFGFTVAGFIAVFVPQSFWNAVFLGAGSEAPSLPQVIENAAVAPIVAFFTFIGSMGNVPLAAMLWAKNASFGGVMAFLGADLVAGTVIYIHAKYYGWGYALYLSAVLYVCMVLAGITVHYLFSIAGMLPTERPSLQEMVQFGLDYTFFLNLGFGVIATLLFVLHARGTKQGRSHAARAA